MEDEFDNIEIVLESEGGSLNDSMDENDLN